MNQSILIADSDELIRDMLAIQLSSRGYRCRAVADGQAALASLAEAPSDLLLMDAQMPMLSGAETLMRIRANPALSHIPVLILTQAVAPRDRDKLIALGASAVMTKPFCSGELQEAIASLLAKPAGDRVKRLRVTVLGAAALAAALPSVAAHSAPATAGASSGLSSESGNNSSVGHTAAGQPSIPVPRPDLQSPAPATVSAPENEPDEGDEAWQTRHSLVLVQGHSWIDQLDGARWNDTAIAYGIRPTADSGYTAEASRAQRFGRIDYQLSLRGDWRLGRRTSAFVTGAITPSAELREKWGVRAGFSRTVRTHLEIGASSRLGEFADGTKLSVTPYVALSTTGETATLVAEFINLWSLTGPADHRTGYGLRLRAQPYRKLSTLAGFARYPEVELGTARDVRSIYGGLSYEVNATIGISVSYANDRYRGLFTREGVSAALTYRWRGAG